MSGDMVNINGIALRGPLPALADQFKGHLLVIGSAPCVRDDLALFDDTHQGHRMVVNDVGKDYEEKAEHWCSLHPEFFFPSMLEDYRYGHNYGGGQHVWTHADKEAPGVECAWGILNVGGTSGLFAAQVGLALGYKRIILAGVPMDNSGHYFDIKKPATDFGVGEAIEMVWRHQIKEVFQDRVRSLSGRTRDWLGEPDAAWLGYAWPPMGE